MVFIVHFEAQKIFSILKSPSLGQFLPWCKYHQKADLHYSDYGSKLVHFEAQKIFLCSKSPSFERFLP